MKVIKIVCAVSAMAMVGLYGCKKAAGNGTSTSTSTAGSVSSFIGAIGPSGISSNLMTQMNQSKKELMIQKRILKSYAMSPQSLGLCAYIETSDFEFDASCTTTCTDTSDGVSIFTACTDVDSTETCGAEQYVLENFDMTTTTVISGLSSISDDALESAEMSIDMDAAGKVTNSTLTGDVDCNLNFSLALTDAADVADFDCADTNFSCVAGGVTYTCAQLEAAQAASACNDSDLN